MTTLSRQRLAAAGDRLVERGERVAHAPSRKDDDRQRVVIGRNALCSQMYFRRFSTSSNSTERNENCWQREAIVLGILWTRWCKG